MMCAMSENDTDTFEDLLYKTYGEHPITYADTYMEDNKDMKPLETVLTHTDDLCSNQSLDYVFQYSMKKQNDQNQVPPEKTKRRLNVMDGSAKVEKFFVEDCKFTQLSDHYGVMVSLDYTEEISLSPTEITTEKIEKKEKITHAGSVHHVELTIGLE